MLSEDLRRYLHSNFKRLNFIWLAFQAAAAACYFVARIAGMDWGPEHRVAIGFAPAFYALAAVLAIVSRLHQRHAFTDERISEFRVRGFAPNAPTDAVLARRDGYVDLDAYERSLLAVFAHVQSSYIVTWFMQEAVAILGLVLAIATRDASSIVIFNIAALGLLFTTRPRAARHLERAARLS